MQLADEFARARGVSVPLGTSWPSLAAWEALVWTGLVFRVNAKGTIGQGTRRLDLG